MTKKNASLQKLNSQEKQLMKRYLVWCYKTTREELDLTDRKFTQLVVDREIDRYLQRGKAKLASLTDREALNQHLKDLRIYIEEKQKRAWESKFQDPAQGLLKPKYAYLILRLEAIENTIVHFFSKRVLKEIQRLYEQEMTGRILKAREHS